MLSGEADYYRNYYEYYYSKTEIPKYMLLRTCLASLFVICFIQVNGQIRIYIVQWLIFIFHCASQYRLAHIIANSTWTQWRMLSCCFYVIWSGIYYLQNAFRRLKTIRIYISRNSEKNYRQDVGQPFSATRNCAEFRRNRPKLRLRNIVSLKNTFNFSTTNEVAVKVP